MFSGYAWESHIGLASFLGWSVVKKITMSLQIYVTLLLHIIRITSSAAVLCLQLFTAPLYVAYFVVHFCYK